MNESASRWINRAIRVSPLRHFVLLGGLILLMMAQLGCMEDDLKGGEKGESDQKTIDTLAANVLDYRGTPENATDRSSLAFSDQGAWFAYGFQDDSQFQGGFTGPFLMTQENGIWCSRNLSQVSLKNPSTGEKIDYEDFKIEQNSYLTHLEQTLENADLRIEQTLFFASEETAIFSTRLTNLKQENLEVQVSVEGKLLVNNLHFGTAEGMLTLESEKSKAIGYLAYSRDAEGSEVSDSSFFLDFGKVSLGPSESWGVNGFEMVTFASDIDGELALARSAQLGPEEYIARLRSDKLDQLNKLGNLLDERYQQPQYRLLLEKAVLTLQNNWRSAAGELEYAGLFPSYHYIWFHGFWAWDSWKHAVALAHFQPDLARDQVRAMYAMMTPSGFVPDCIYRDTTIEAHNYRNTKPPLSAWAVAEIHRLDPDLDFLKEIYPQIVKQHEWWYRDRDHDRDGLCEYGSTDGTAIAGKWESGMDNAVRFDSVAMLENGPDAYSINQESVDLNAYLYAEKLFLKELAGALGNGEDEQKYSGEAAVLKGKIQSQFYDIESGWFYDTDLDGGDFIKVMGCEGWIPLWAKVASPEQAERIRANMMDSSKFNTKVPFQTLSADHPKFKPDGGYWRGPNWLDQSYFGVKGLHNYEFHEDAYLATDKLIGNAEGVLGKGKSIRENYHPLTGAGLESRNFSWSAAHYILLLLKE